MDIFFYNYRIQLVFIRENTLKCYGPANFGYPIAFHGEPWCFSNFRFVNYVSSKNNYKERAKIITNVVGGSKYYMIVSVEETIDNFTEYELNQFLKLKKIFCASKLFLKECDDDEYSTNQIYNIDDLF